MHHEFISWIKMIIQLLLLICIIFWMLNVIIFKILLLIFEVFIESLTIVVLNKLFATITATLDLIIRIRIN